MRAGHRVSTAPKLQGGFRCSCRLAECEEQIVDMSRYHTTAEVPGHHGVWDAVTQVQAPLTFSPPAVSRKPPMPRHMP
jgi:hypothetical protein